MNKLIEFRCKKCNKLLGKVGGNAEIVCTRCSYTNTLNYATREITMKEPQKKHYERTTSSGLRFY